MGTLLLQQCLLRPLLVVHPADTWLPPFSRSSSLSVAQGFTSWSLCSVAAVCGFMLRAASQLRSHDTSTMQNAWPLTHCSIICRGADGADLMLPGIQPEALPPLPAGAVCSLRVPGNPAPIAARCCSAVNKL
jgi:hypothetical protein